MQASRQGEPAEQTSSLIAHKFVRLKENLWTSLESGQFYFAPPKDLNDPADCRIDLSKAFRLARRDIGNATGQRFDKYFLDFARRAEELMRDCGVFSLSGGSIDGDDERLLWAHYAKNHEGVCLTFEIPPDFINNNLLGYAPVTYSTERLFQAMRQLDLTKEPEFDAELKPVITAALTTKSPEWKYEKEARLVAFRPGLIQFERKFLRQITFGIGTALNDRSRVIEIAAGYPNCGLAEMFQLDDDVFKLSVRDASK